MAIDYVNVADVLNLGAIDHLSKKKYRDLKTKLQNFYPFDSLYFKAYSDSLKNQILVFVQEFFRFAKDFENLD